MNRHDAWARLLDHSDRRSFLKACAALGLAVSAGGAARGVRRFTESGGDAVTVTRTAMGTYVTVIAVDPSRGRAQEATGRAFAEMDRLIALLGRYDTSSPVGVLNRDGRIAAPPPELLHVLGRARHFNERSGGAFDVTVAPVVDLLAGAFAGHSGSAPSQRDIETAVARVGFDRLAAGPREISFCADGMGLTLDGIAKGYIVDRMSETLSECGVTNHLVNAGGDIRTRGERAPHAPWTIAVADPRGRRSHPDVIHVTDGAVATSGDYEVFFDREKLYHHIVDPRDGQCPRECSSVSIRATTAIDADALSTAAFVLGTEKGAGLIERLGHECLIIDGQGQTRHTPGWHTAS